MPLAAQPPDETARLAELRDLAILDTPDEDRFDRIIHLACRRYAAPIAMVSLVDAERQWFKSCIGLEIRETRRSESFASHAILANSALIVTDTLQDQRFGADALVASEPHIRFIAAYPLKSSSGANLGALCICDCKPRAFDAEDLDDLETLAHWVEHELLKVKTSEVQRQLVRELDSAKRQSLLDPLLHIWNRRAILDILRTERERALRGGLSLAVVMIDPDYFKSINDRFGHSAGDAVLELLVKKIRTGLRAYDALGRYGGDEFLLVFGNTSGKAAYSISDKILQTISQWPFRVKDRLHNVTISLGVAVCDFANSNFSEAALIDAADEALYRAKNAGRNRLELITME
jgi:diguanylate cyclase (GGDEF)-like protein